MTYHIIIRDEMGRYDRLEDVSVDHGPVDFLFPPSNCILAKRFYWENNFVFLDIFSIVSRSNA